jgi:hypothetical protein
MNSSGHILNEVLKVDKAGEIFPIDKMNYFYVEEIFGIS